MLDRRMPQTVHGAITSRIDRLSPTQQLTVKAASVIGRVFAVVILREIHPLREAVARTLTADLTAIERANLTVLETPEPDLHYLFKHVITQEAAYNLMLLSQRRQPAPLGGRVVRAVGRRRRRPAGPPLAAGRGAGQGDPLPGAGRRRGPAGGRLRRGGAVLHRAPGGRRRRAARPRRRRPPPGRARTRTPSGGPAGSTSSATPTWGSASSRPSRSTCTPPWPCSAAGPRPAAAGSRASWPGRPASSSATGSGRGRWSPAPRRPGRPLRRRPRSTSACSWSTTTPAGGPRRCTRRSRA